jgi:hypothetical protein
MRLLLAYGIYWLPPLLLTLTCVCVIYDNARKSTKDALPPFTLEPTRTPIAIHIPEVHRRGRQTVYITMSLLLGIAAGYAGRDHQLISNTHLYEGVTVDQQLSEKEYKLIIPGYATKWDFEFCHPLKMPSVLIDIKYEQKYGCKQVYGVGFVQPHKEKTNAAIQNGRYSSPSAETASR